MDKIELLNLVRFSSISVKLLPLIRPFCAHLSVSEMNSARANVDAGEY